MKKCLMANSCVFFLYPQTLQQMHRDIVYTYPPEVTPLGHSPRCAVQGMYVPRRLITVQGHPEFTEEIVSEILDARVQAGVFTEDEYRDAMNRVKNHHDGVAVGVTFLRFLLED
jgi:GMP synthase-like glutamine amidotransferase